jgi:hypothetical protein
VPVGLALGGHPVGDEDCQEDRRQLVPVEDECHRELANEERQEHQERGGEQRDLRAGTDGDVDRQVHLVLRGHVHGHPVLGCVSDDRHDDNADEELADADLLGGLADRPDEDLGHQTDGGAGDRQQDHGPPDRPGLAVVLGFA